MRRIAHLLKSSLSVSADFDIIARCYVLANNGFECARTSHMLISMTHFASDLVRYGQILSDMVRICYILHIGQT